MMEKKTQISLPAMGGSSLLTIFAVLCLTIFALLSLTTARAEQRLADASAQAVTAWYQADNQAQAVFAQLRSGEAVAGVQEDNGTFYYTCPISHSQHLAVTLEKDGSHWRVLRWQAVAPEQIGDKTIPVWNGGGTP